MTEVPVFSVLPAEKTILVKYALQNVWLKYRGGGEMQ